MDATNTKRIISIDALRGFALFGILWVNIYVFNAPYAYYSEFYGAFTGINAWLVWFSSSLVAGKFMFIFAFLFGYGAELQFSRMSDFNRFKQYWNNRMVVLAFFGIGHIVFFWFGDILLPYALLGFFIPVLLKLKPKPLIGVGLTLYLSSAVVVFVLKLFDLPDPGIASALSLDEFINIYSNASFTELLPYRIEEFWSLKNEKFVFYLPKELALFCFGIAAGKLQLIEGHRFTSVHLLVGLGVAILWNVFKGKYFALYSPDKNPLIIPFLIIQNIAFEIVLGTVYIFGFVKLCNSQIGNFLTDWLALVGRMSLTNYFLQSFICVLLFYGYGLGWSGTLNPTELAICTFVIFISQGVFSIMWLSRFKQGPLEYVWRRLAGKKA